MNSSNNNEKIGSVRIASDVVPLIAALSVNEVEGVVPVQERKKGLAKINIKKAIKGIKVEIKGRKVKVDMAVGIFYGFQVPEVSRNVQNAVKTAIETMTGLEVTDVNVRISSVNPA